MRGRGGRGGGRGGISKTFNAEQASALGINSNEGLSAPATQPPPLYPILNRHPVPLTVSNESDYLLTLRQDFLDHLHLSGSFLQLTESKLNQNEQEIVKLVAQLPITKEEYDWRLMPFELRPKSLGRRLKRKIKQEINIDEKLSKLEQLETKNKEAPVIKTEEDDEDREVVDDDHDEEMDDGTDYANNYFDNGEDYEDEDDNLDDGPIY